MKLWDVDFETVLPPIVKVSSLLQIVSIDLPMKVVFFFFLIRMYIQVAYVSKLVVALQPLLVLAKRLLMWRRLMLVLLVKR